MGKVMKSYMRGTCEVKPSIGVTNDVNGVTEDRKCWVGNEAVGCFYFLFDASEDLPLFFCEDLPLFLDFLEDEPTPFFLESSGVALLFPVAPAFGGDFLGGG